LLRADVVKVERGTVVTIRSFGLGVRATQGDAGATLGMDRRIYVYPRGDEDTLIEGTQWFFIRLPDTEPVAIATRALGAEARVSGRELGFTLGFREALTVAVGQDTYLRLRLIPDDPGATRLTWCDKGNPCWPEQETSVSRPLH
jgi:hypothetical protein